MRTRTEERQKRKTKDEDEKRPKHHAVRANKYGQAGLEPRHSDKSERPEKKENGNATWCTITREVDVDTPVGCLLAYNSG